MDAIASVAFEMDSAAAPNGVAAAANAGNTGTAPAVFDVSHFDAAYSAAAVNATPAAEPVARVSGSESQGLRTVMETLDRLNGKAESLGSRAVQMQGGQMKPSDILMMTLRAQEFLFHCELTSNVANRTSDGVQQLFREQS
jgi:TolA-binding protein